MLLDTLSALIRLNDLESTIPPAERQTPQVLREIERCRQAISADILKRYEDRRRKHGKTAIVPIERCSCSGCNITLPAAGLEEIAEDVLVCSHCDRLIYDPELVFDFV